MGECLAVDQDVMGSNPIVPIYLYIFGGFIMKIKRKNGKYVEREGDNWVRYTNLTIHDFFDCLNRIKTIVWDWFPLVFFFGFMLFSLILCILNIIYG